MKKQHLTITILDRRKSPPEKRVKRFARHQDYLKVMGRLMGLPDAHLHEQINTTVTIYSENTLATFSCETTTLTHSAFRI